VAGGQSSRRVTTMWKISLSTLGSVSWALSIVTMFVAAGLPWAPPSHLAKAAAMGATSILAVLSALVFLGAHWQRNPGRPRRVLTVCLSAAGLALTVVLVWGALLGAYGKWAVAGEELRETVDDREHSRKIFVYVSWTVPKGDISSRLAVQEGRWPLERTLLNVRNVFVGLAERDATGLVLVFGNNMRVRYRFTDGTLELIH